MRILQIFNHIKAFINQYLKQLKRKWFLLPLTFSFPLIVVGGVIIFIASFFNPEEEAPIYVGIVDKDQSEETEMIIDLLEETSELGALLRIETTDQKQAEEDINADKLSSYIILPENFTCNLYEGVSVTMDVVGNSKQKTESQIVKGMIESVVRHIETSQANILLINEYAQKTSMDDSTRIDFIKNEFMHSFMNVLGRDKMIDEEKKTNVTTSSPVEYFSLSTLFVVLTIWLVTIYQFLLFEQPRRMTERLRLYGVMSYEQMIARMLITMFITLIFGSCLFFIWLNLTSFEFIIEDYLRIAIVTLLYSLTFLHILAILECMFSNVRIRLFVHSLFTFIWIGFSGAIVPTIYFPLSLQDWLTYIPSYEALYWLQEVILNERIYVDYKSLATFSLLSIAIFIGLSLGKEHIRH